MADDSGKLEMMRHSAAHIMAEAVLSMFPDAKFGIGPSIENGFYYDFELPRSLTPEDLPAIEARMHEIIASDDTFTREELTKEDVRRYRDNLLKHIKRTYGKGAKRTKRKPCKGCKDKK